ncbi:MAG: ribosomal L7Ae/L30e/S12e/Gadd45 family protein [Oscillospiraceae bacterium]|jgi:ribosomal protein L7Ae-like RNA K-turn-binding protein|nr:ribosomal L7Ae/L30e/S12e/Gadd45 family protein [Oscillospiraceae bacterium]
MNTVRNATHVSKTANRALSLLGIAKKAGRLEIGTASVTEALRRGKARLILSAADSSDPSKRRARAAAKAAGVVYAELDATKEELAGIIGRGLPGTIAVTDAGLAFSVASRLSERNPERYAEVAQALSEDAAKTLARRRAAARGIGKGQRCGKCRGGGCAGKPGERPCDRAKAELRRQGG